MTIATPLEEVLDAVPVLARPDREVEELPGGLTNANLQVDDGPRALRGPALERRHGAARDRPRRGARELGARRPRSGVGAAVVAYLPEHNALVFEFIEGRTLRPEDLRARRRDRARRRGLPRAARRRARSASDFDMFEIQPRYLAIVQERGLRLPDRYLDFEPQVAAHRGGLRRARRRSPSRATTTCWPRTSSTRRRRLPADRLRVLGQRRAVLRARQHLERVEPLARPARGARRLPTGAAAAPQGRPGAPVGADVQVRLDALGLDPGRRLRHRLRLLVVGDGEVRARGRGVRRPRASSACSTRRGRPD